jgi:hypothetical protein
MKRAIGGLVMMNDKPKDDERGDALAMVGMAIFFAGVLFIRWLS